MLTRTGTQPKRIACIGEAMIELSFRTPDATAADIGVAGDVLNTAYYLRRCLLGDTTAVAFVSALGTDAFSGRIRDFVARHGIDTDDIALRDGMTPGLYAITTDDAGERRFQYWRSTSAARHMFDAPEGTGRLAACDVAYLSGVTLAILTPDGRDALFDWLGPFRERGGTVIFDSNYRPALWPDAATAREVTEQMWRLTDIALPSFDDEAALFGDASIGAARDRIRAWGPREGAIKNRHFGPLPMGDDPCHQSYPPAKPVIDTTAAGDSFNGAFIAGIVDGANPCDAMLRAHALAARIVGRRGAIIEDL